MKKIDFNFSIKNLKGEIVSDFIIKEHVGNLMASQSTNKPDRTFEIAQKIYNEGIIEIPSEDVILLRNAILNNTTLIDLVKAQLIAVIDVDTKKAE